MPDISQLDSEYLDALKEVGNMGAGNASGALSGILNKKVVLEIPGVHLTATQEIPKLIGGPQKLVVGIYNSIAGDVSGTMLVVMPTKNAMLLADVMQNKKLGSTLNLDNASQAKLKEMGDVVSKTYLESIKSFLDIKIDRNPQRIVATFGESLVDLVLLGVREKFAFFINTNFKIPDVNVEGKFILLIAIESITKIMEAIKKK